MENAIFNQKKEGYINYSGNENCERLIDFNLFNDNELTILLPPLTEHKVSELNNNYNKIRNNEIVVNDWGSLYLLQSLKHKKILLGRWLSRKVIPDIIADNKVFDLGVKRIETDYIDFQKIIRNEELFKDFKFSYYYPYVPVTITKRCSFQNKHYGKCDGCKKKIVINKSCKQKFILNGNVLMIKAKMPEIRSKLIDRCVFNGFTK